MSQFVKTKRQANFKDFKGLIEQKNRCIQLIRVKIGLLLALVGL
jgi:hypothetical protein